MEADQGQEGGLFVVLVIVVVLCWIFNDILESWLGLKGLKALRAVDPESSEKNTRGIEMNTDPMRLPVTAAMVVLTYRNWQKKQFESSPPFAFFALFLRLYLVGEMWTRGMPRIFRCLFDFGIRTNYFEPLICLLEMGFVVGSDKYFDLGKALIIPWIFVSLNPETPMCALITWSAATSYILTSRYAEEWTLIAGLQVRASMDRLVRS